jgi:hypothetical protein
MSETHLNYENGKIKIECDSNSLAAFMGIAQMAIDHVERESSKINSDKLSPDDLYALDCIQERAQELSEAMSDFDSYLLNLPSDTDLKFYYEVLP